MFVIFLIDNLVLFVFVVSIIVKVSVCVLLLQYFSTCTFSLLAFLSLSLFLFLYRLTPSPLPPHTTMPISLTHKHLNVSAPWAPQGTSIALAAATIETLVEIAVHGALFDPG